MRLSALLVLMHVATARMLLPEYMELKMSGLLDQFMNLLQLNDRHSASMMLDSHPQLGRSALYRAVGDRQYDLLYDLITKYDSHPDLWILKKVCDDYQIGNKGLVRIIVTILEKMRSVEGEFINTAMGNISSQQKLRFATLAHHAELYVNLISVRKEVSETHALWPPLRAPEFLHLTNF